MGHTKELLVFLPIFVYYVWKYHPFWAFLYLALLYCFHEAMFNLFFLAYYLRTFQELVKLPNWLFIIWVSVTIMIFVKRWYSVNRKSIFMFGMFLSLMTIWIVGFHFVVTLNSFHPALNAVNATKLIPNLFESLYNLVFGIFFVTFVKVRKESLWPFGNPDRSASTVRNS